MAICRFLITAAAGAALAVAQSQTPKTQTGQKDPAGQRDTTTTQSSTTTRSGSLASSDRDFLQKTYENNVLEVEMAKLATQKASNSQVKSFAQRLVDDHSKAIKEMEDLAKRKNFTLTKAQNLTGQDARSGNERTTASTGKDPKTSTPAGQTDQSRTDRSRTDTATTGQQSHDAHSTLSSMSGDAFDRAWVREMVEEHEMGVKSFETQERSAADQDLKSFVAKTLPTLRAHLDQAKSLEQNLGKSGSSAPTSTPRNDNNKNKNEKPATER